VNAPASSDQIAAKLYLHAVLPALEDLGQVSARARALIANWNCGVEFAVFNGGGAAVQFNHGAVSVSPVRSLDAGISLFFLSANQLVKQFDGQGFSLPLPRRGLWSPRPADVTVTFHDEPAALAALRGELDEMAATGRGDLIVRGLIPLAETLGLVMARAEEYIERRTKT
jgi:hypothetical protein